jgi:putative ATPase
VGLADPQALAVAVAARDAYEMLGSPEGELALAQAVVYLALAPKSNAVYTALQAAQQQAEGTTHLAPPAIILNAPTKLMKQLGYGKGYQYDHDIPEGFSGQNYFPADMERAVYYHPVERGFEREMKKRIDYFAKLRQRKESRDASGDDFL